MRYLQQTTLFATLYPINNLGTIHENDLILYINRFCVMLLTKEKKRNNKTKQTKKQLLFHFFSFKNNSFRSSLLISCVVVHNTVETLHNIPSRTEERSICADLRVIGKVNSWTSANQGQYLINYAPTLP